jgi:hypothetical protein
MFDRVPDAGLVADLVAAQGAAAEVDAGRAAAELIEQLQAWDRVAWWVHSQAVGHWTAPGLMEALNSLEDESHGSTEEVSR